MKKKGKDDKYHHILIVPEFISKSKKYYYLFHPKEIIVLEPFECYLSIINLSNKPFPGGKIENLKIKYTEAQGEENFDDISISKIPSIKNKQTHHFKTPKMSGRAISIGTAWINLTLKSFDDKPIQYYQLNRERTEETLLSTPEWQDCFHVSSRQEIHQRYTNYILLGLTVVTILLFILNLILLLK